MGFFDDLREKLNDPNKHVPSDEDTLNALYKQAKEAFPDLTDEQRLRVLQFGNFIASSHLQGLLVYNTMVAPLDYRAVLETYKIVAKWTEIVANRIKDFQDEDEE